MHVEDSSFHVVITSYKIAVRDFKPFQRIKWWYVILDEAQAIKNTSSQRWRTLMSLKCRNRLLLSGTPIQNSMQELWALLHFIMPSLFDSHEEFNEWFSKDIESCADQPSKINENQLNRLHSILKPFMLRRIKKDVEFELTDKIEVMVHCGLSKRQRLLYQAMKNQISPHELLSYGFGSSQQVQLMNIVMQFRKVCNHPDLFGKRDVFITHYSSPPVYYIPQLLFNEGITGQPHSKSYVLRNLFNIFHPEHTHRSLFHINVVQKNESPFSFVRLMGFSLQEFYEQTRADFNIITNYCLTLRENIQQMHTCLIWHWNCYPENILLTPVASRFFSKKYNLIKEFNFLKTLNFCCHSDVKVVSKNRNPSEIFRVSKLETISYPKWLIMFQERLISTPRETYCASRRAAYQHVDQSVSLSHLGQTLLTNQQQDFLNNLFLRKIETNYWNNISLPQCSSLVTDSGKLYGLDKLLCRLKKGGHRVLIFSQMTKMIAILENYMSFRGFSYVRLDGSLQINKREDMVENFQANDDVFVFLLSTRAGGIGINLTAADTVIFYDSDWNPTVDLQAMDRTHRLGQTRQVTVYRLICKDTIEDRIMQRACEKSEIQKMVISGGKYKAEPQTATPNEVLKMLLDETSANPKLAFDKTFQDLVNAANSPEDYTLDYSFSTRRRGRPAGSKNKKTLMGEALGNNEMPVVVSTPVSDEILPRVKRRGRPVGSKNVKSKLFKDGVDAFSRAALQNAKYGEKSRYL